MRLTPTRFSESAANGGSRCGFTLVEVLAALVFMAVLIPVTMRAVGIASQAGQVGERKIVASRIAERVLNEWMVTGGLRQTTSNGQIEEGNRTFRWTMRTEQWREDAMTLVSVRVAYDVQGREYDVNLSTLFDPNQTTTTSQTQ